MKKQRSEHAFFRYHDFHLYNINGEKIGSAKPSFGKIGILVWDRKSKPTLGGLRGGLFYGEFESLKSATDLIGNIHGLYNTMYHCLNDKGLLIWEGPYEHAIDLDLSRLPKRLSVEERDEIKKEKNEIFKQQATASLGMIRFFSAEGTIFFSGPIGPPPPHAATNFEKTYYYKGEFTSLQEAVDQVKDLLGGWFGGEYGYAYENNIRCYDDQGICLVDKEGYKLKSILDTGKFIAGGTASELRRLKI